MGSEPGTLPACSAEQPAVLRARAPAKLNLFLRVVGRRPDGFHELETVFQAVDLHDELTFALSDGLHLSGGSDEAPPGPENLVLRAAEALREATGCTKGAAIHLEKRIPVGAGLGGGSSDAAATLVALNRLWGLGLPDECLAGLAAGLGSDVPFALRGGTAVGRGRGEVLEPVPTPGVTPLESGGAVGAHLPTHRPPDWFMLLGPSFPVATVRAYALYAPASPGAPTLDSFLAAWKARDLDQVAQQMRNDLEAGVFEEWPQLAALRGRLLEAGALGARMTGSGSVIFGLMWDEDHAQQVARQFEGTGLWVRVVRAIGSGAQVTGGPGIRDDGAK